MATIGMLPTLASVSSKPSIDAAWALIMAQVGRPPSGDDRNLPVETGLPSELTVYSRVKTWWEACEV